MKNKKQPNVSTFTVVGMDRISATTTTCIPRSLRIMRSGRSARSSRKLRNILNSGLFVAIDIVDVSIIRKSTMFHALRRYAPGCMTNPIAITFIRNS